MGRSGLDRRYLVVGGAMLAVLIVGDILLFGWLIFRSLSEREISRVVLETRAEVEGLAERLADRARSRGEDLYTALATERETQTYIDSILRERQLVREVEIRDREERLIYRMRTEETIPVEGGDLTLENPEIPPPGYEERHFTREYSVDAYDLTVPIEDLGQIRIGLSQEELARRVGLLRQDLLRQVGVVSGFTVVVLIASLLGMGWLLSRAEKLRGDAHTAERMAELGTLAAGLAHEIRNPLNSLRLNMQLLEEEIPPEERSSTAGRLLSLTASETNRLEGLVTDFLAYAKPRPLELERLEMTAVLEDLQVMVAAEFRERGVDLHLVDESHKAVLEADPQQLKQLLLNLLKNALSAAETKGRKGTVELRSRRSGDGISLEVWDNGPGIPEHDQSRVFELFYSSRKGGTGLGLAIAQRIADAHQGRLSLESPPGQGTTARLWLPGSRRESGEAGQPPASSS